MMAELQTTVGWIGACPRKILGHLTEKRQILNFPQGEKT